MRGDLGLSVAFFLSGAAGLVFQIVWFYQSGLVFGNSIASVTLVLSSFMGGLALGNLFAGLYGTRQRRLLMVYAGLEILVAVSGLAVTYILPRLTVLVVPLTLSVRAVPWAVHLTRLAVAFAVLLVPSTAMGATLPVLVGALHRADRTFGDTLGRLYGWNTLGAVVGAIGAETIVVARAGVVGSAWTAAALNIVAAALAGLVARGREATAPGPSPSNVPSTQLSVASDVNPLLIAAFLSGFALLALEVIWFRFLSMYVLTTTLTLSIMLAVVLAAIALGGFLAAAWLRRESNAARYSSLIALAAGIMVIAAYSGFRSLTAGAQVREWWRVLWFAVALAFPTSCLSGALFTLIGDAVNRRTGESTRAAARITLSNTLGGLCGPPLAAFVLLPAVGMEGGFFALAAVYGVIGVFLRTTGSSAEQRQLTRVAPRPPTQPRTRRVPFAVGAAVPWVFFAAALALFPFGAMRRVYFNRAVEAYASDGSEIIATREGPSETIFLMQLRWLGSPVYHRLVTNGFSMTGTTVPAMRYMRYFAYLPMFLHETPIRSALVVCYGVGVTARAVLDIPSIESVDVAEISGDVVRMSDRIYGANDHPLRDPRVHLTLEDGRFFLETSRRQYDLITGEPPPPRTPGAVNIYTREFFSLVRDHLAEGGITTYWIPVARPDPGTDIDTAMRAFCEVFDDCSLWNATPFDLILVGSRHATGAIDERLFMAPWQAAQLAGRFREVGFEQPEQIGATFLGDADYVRRLVADTPPLTDDFPQRLRPAAARASLSDPRYAVDPKVARRYLDVIDPARALSAFHSSPLIGRRWPPGLKSRTLPYFETQRIMNSVLWDGGNPLLQIDDLHRLLTSSTLQTLPLWLLGSDDVKQRIATASVEQSATVEYARGLQALSRRDFPSAAASFRRADAGGLQSPLPRALLVYALCLMDRHEEARAAANGIRPQNADENHFWTWMGRTFNVGPMCTRC